MPIFEQLQRAGFNGVEFPVLQIDVKGSIRDHIHIYPHAVGGQPEKMGRNLYLITMTADFAATFRAYPNLWPAKLAQLRKAFEQQTTAGLVIPTIGTIQAYCRNWSQTMSNKMSSGEKVSFEFVEDQGTADLVSALVNVRVGDLSSRVQNFSAQAALDSVRKDPSVATLLDGIATTANGIIGIADQFELEGNLLNAKLDFLSNLIAQADRIESVFGDPANYPIIEALHALWDSVTQLQINTSNAKIDPQTYVVPSKMAVNALSLSLYGNTDHSVELLQLNAIADAFAVPAGFRLRYIPSS